jgi:Galactose oxidase, central domain/Kelch motif
MQRFFAFQSFPAVLTALLLTACGGGSGGSSSPPLTTPPPARAATHLSIAAPANVAAGTAFNIMVTALDASNNVVTGYSGTVHFTSTDAQAVLPANSALANGTTTLSAALESAGGQTITGTDTAAPSITGTSSAINIPTATSRFQNTRSMGTARVSHTATLLGDGAVLVAGGMDGTVALSSTELFDPAIGGFTPSGNMHAARASHTATLLSHGPLLTNGKVLITGGGDATSQSLSTVELFTPRTGAFTATAKMKIARRGHTATLLNSGKVLVTGGVDASGNVLKTAEIFDPSAGTFTLTTGSMVWARAHHNATLLGNGKVLITGYEAQAELFNPLTQTFTTTASTYEPNPQVTATWLNDDKVLVIEFYAGFSHGHPNGLAQLYDSSSGTFAFAGCFYCSAGRSRHTATLRNDGKVLVAGGGLVTLSQEGQPPVVTASAELFDPMSGTFVPTDNMVLAREYHTATLLNNGDVLITGGRDAGGNTLAAAELYH